MKKILFMVSSMNIGGVEKSLLSLLSVIPKEKYEITLLLLEKKGGFLRHVPEWITVEEAAWFKKVKPIIIQPPQKTISDYIKNKEFLKVPTFITSYILSKKLKDRYMYYNQVFKDIPNDLNAYDVAIAYQGPTDIIDFYIANKVTAKKKVSWVHFDVSKHQINQKLYQKMHKRFDKVFTVSEEAKKRLIEKIPNDETKTEIFLNVISSDLVNKMALEPVEFDHNFKGKKIVTVGRLSKEKGQDMAIKVLSKLLKNGCNVRWYCIGDGKDREEYEQLIEQFGLKDDFILLGSKENPYPYIANADIYVQTSRHEGFCLTLAEARCLRKPIVTTNFTGAYEQLTNGHDGLIVNFDEKDLYENIGKLIENPEKCEGLANNLTKINVDTTTEVKKLLNYIG
ncbi:glycosyltransferase [Domibacillus mangrovi]|uniref:Glycosyl transferase n=1 Tax=Domibacillus mangrovi TaxID=1714354 RepID=A0A1Q5P2T9_9BACI|nr:glycosyltransferase [Domibacillus mangrovi]OKL36564.1 glycosyl transferase [Domibacillus mangrovi]